MLFPCVDQDVGLDWVEALQTYRLTTDYKSHRFCASCQWVVIDPANCKSLNQIPLFTLVHVDASWTPPNRGELVLKARSDTSPSQGASHAR